MDEFSQINSIQELYGQFNRSFILCPSQKELKCLVVISIQMYINGLDSFNLLFPASLFSSIGQKMILEMSNHFVTAEYHIMKPRW